MYFLYLFVLLSVFFFSFICRNETETVRADAAFARLGKREATGGHQGWIWTRPPVRCVCAPRVGGPKRCAKGGRPKVSRFFTLFRRKFRSFISTRVAAVRGCGPPKVRVWASLESAQSSECDATNFHRECQPPACSQSCRDICGREVSATRQPHLGVANLTLRGESGMRDVSAVLRRTRRQRKPILRSIVFSGGWARATSLLHVSQTLPPPGNVWRNLQRVPSELKEQREEKKEDSRSGRGVLSSEVTEETGSWSWCGPSLDCARPRCQRESEGTKRVVDLCFGCCRGYNKEPDMTGCIPSRRIGQNDGDRNTAYQGAVKDFGSWSSGRFQRWSSRREKRKHVS